MFNMFKTFIKRNYICYIIYIFFVKLIQSTFQICSLLRQEGLLNIIKFVQTILQCRYVIKTTTLRFFQQFIIVNNINNLILLIGIFTDLDSKELLKVIHNYLVRNCTCKNKSTFILWNINLSNRFTNLNDFDTINC